MIICTLLLWRRIDTNFSQKCGGSTFLIIFLVSGVNRTIEIERFFVREIYFSNYDCHLFYKKLVDKKNNVVKFDVIPKTNGEYVSAPYGYLRFIASFRFLSSSLKKLVETLDNDDFNLLKTDFPQKWEYLNEKMADPYEF